MRLGIASDHAGFEMKQFLKGLLRADDCDVQDFGAFAFTATDDYPDFAAALGNAIHRGEIDAGILLCGSGIGIAIAANKVPGVRAAVVNEPGLVREAVEEHDMNVLTLAASMIDRDTAAAAARIFADAWASRLSHEAPGVATGGGKRGA